jgi:hypothetical protein
MADNPLFNIKMPVKVTGDFEATGKSKVDVVLDDTTLSQFELYLQKTKIINPIVKNYVDNADNALATEINKKANSSTTLNMNDLDKILQGIMSGVDAIISADNGYTLEIESSNGNIFKNGEIQTTLTAKVFQSGEEVTDQFDVNQFKWTKVLRDGTLDKVWNATHYGGTKTITISSQDIYVRSTFFCDLVDLNTNSSLLTN